MTQKRPIFSVSRRPPQRAVVAPVEQAGGDTSCAPFVPPRDTKERGSRTASNGLYSICRLEIQSIRAVATGSMARLSHQATSSPKRWMSR
jgi:hypothetical protein